MTYEGDNSVLLQQVSKDLVKGETLIVPEDLFDQELKERIDQVHF